MTILITTISIIGLIFSLTKTGLFQKIITVGLCASIFLVWTGDRNILLVSILLQLGLAVISTIYGLTAKGLKTIDRMTIGAFGLVLTLGTLTIIQHYPGQGVLRLALTIPIIMFLTTTIKHGREQPKEFGFMLIWTTIAAVQLSKYLIK